MSAPTSRRLELATGLGVHALEWNADRAGHDHTVVLVHGFLDLAWGWKATVDAGLADGLHVVAPDMRGHGDSDRVGPGGYYHFFDYVADLREIVDAVGRDRVSLVGHSMGGTICSYFAGAFPERVHRLALLEGLGPLERSTELGDRIRQWSDGWRKASTREPRSYASCDEAAARLQSHDPLLDPAMASFLGEVGTRERDDGRRVFKHDPLHLTTSPTPFRVEVARELWQRVTCPVLLVDAAESRFRLADDDLARRVESFAGARLATLAGAGHIMQRHQPAALATLLRDFLIG